MIIHAPQAIIHDFAVLHIKQEMLAVPAQVFFVKIYDSQSFEEQTHAGVRIQSRNECVNA